MEQRTERSRGLRLRGRTYEHQQRARFDWILMMREDAHWFDPLNVSAFEPGYVHGND